MKVAQKLELLHRVASQHSRSIANGSHIIPARSRALALVAAGEETLIGVATLLRLPLTFLSTAFLS